MDDYHDLELSPRPSRSNIDPFYAVKEEVQKDAQLLSADREQWANIMARSDAPSDAEIGRATRAVKSRIKRIEQQVKDLSRTIDQVEKQRSKFPTIDDQELFTRKKFVADVKVIARECRDALSKSASIKSTKSAKKYSSNDDLEAAPAAKHVQQAQQMMEKEQDVHLDDMLSSLQRLGVMGTQVHDELEDQRLLLNEVDQDMDDAGDRMEVVMKKLDKLIGNSNRGKLYIMFFLTLLLVILLFLIIYF
uniref:t-SNARE coiled-coil homology domain-containing protein n=1 Tax=Spongospora subterranea TaxID=70186 RepID=A0A0H5R8Z2_9EUKA|eukprot:CRZ04849.1 hypothetical protein [Spongospora subterranea]